MSREALKLALEALEQLDGIDTETECVTIDVGNVMDAIEEALAQPEQDQFKPDWNTEAVLVEEMQRMAKRIEDLEALAQPQRQPLTHEQRLDLLAAFEPSKTSWNAESILIDMVEAAHGIKENT